METEERELQLGTLSVIHLLSNMVWWVDNKRALQSSIARDFYYRMGVKFAIYRVKCEGGLKHPC